MSPNIEKLIADTQQRHIDQYTNSSLAAVENYVQHAALVYLADTGKLKEDDAYYYDAIHSYAVLKRFGISHDCPKASHALLKMIEVQAKMHNAAFCRKLKKQYYKHMQHLHKFMFKKPTAL